MTKFTKERLQEIAELARKATYKPCAMHMTNLLAVCDSEVIEEIASQLLASMEQEPIYQVQHGDQWRDLNKAQYDDHVNLGAEGLRIVYAAPQLPQPAVVEKAITQHFDTIALDTAKMVMCDVNRRDEFLGGDIQLLSRIQCRIDEACRAAMLQGAEPVSQPYTLPFELWLSQQTGTIDVECGCVMTEVFYHWLRVAYEAGNSPVIQDGWVAVPADMTPEQMRAVQLNSELGAYTAANLTGAYSLFREFWDVAIAAAPQQETK